MDEPPPRITSEDVMSDNLPAYLYLFIHVDVYTRKWSKSCPLHSGPSAPFLREGWLIQGHLLFLPALRHHMLLLHLLLLTSKAARLEHWVNFFLQRPHLICYALGGGGQRGRKPPLQAFTHILKAPEEVSGPFCQN